MWKRQLGREALERVKKGERPIHHPGCINAGVDGLDTLKELMQVDRSLNVIMLSCSNEVGTVVEAIRIGAHDYLTKPFEKTELDAAMLKSRQRSSWPRESGAARLLRPGDRDLSFWRQSPDGANPPANLQIAPVDVLFLSVARAAWGKKWLRMIHLPLEAAKPGVRESELRCIARRTAGIGTFRIRAGSIHGSGAQQTRQV